ncbi:21308_t:CDS:2, partial [Dentiscutata erythropus]
TKDQRLTSEIINPDKKRNRSITVPELKLALKEFVLTYQHKTVLSDLILIEKAKLLASWLHKFKEHNEIGREKLHGEVESVDNDAIIRELLLLQNKSTQHLSGCKKDKERITIALCANANGLHKLKPLIIGKYAKLQFPVEDQIIINLVETFKKTDNKNDKNQEAADDSIKKEIISPNVALKSLENIHTYLLQQEGASEYIKLVGTIEKLSMDDNEDFYYDDDLDFINLLYY